MAIGNPKISIINTVGAWTYVNRVYQLDDDGVFQILNTSANFSSFASVDGGQASVQSKFVRDSDYIVQSHVDGAGFLQQVVKDATSFAVKETITAQTFDPTFRYIRYIKAFTNAFKDYMMYKGGNATPLLLRELTAPDETYVVTETSVNPPFASTGWTRFVRLSKTAKYAFRGRDDNMGISTSAFAYRTSDNNTKAWTWSGETALVLDNTGAAEFSPDETSLYQGTTTGFLNIYGITGGAIPAINLINSLNLGSAVKSIAVHPSGRCVAVGFGTTTTNIYSRVGDVLTLSSSITGAGNILKWTADGKHLIDLGLAKAYSFDIDDLSYTDVSSTMMVNVATYVSHTALTGDISTHTASSGRFGELYSQGGPLIIGGDLETDSYTAIFVNGSYIFDPSHDVNDVLAHVLNMSSISLSVAQVGSKTYINTTSTSYTTASAQQLGGVAIFNVTQDKLLFYFDLADSLPLSAGDTVRLDANSLALISG